MSSPYPRTQTSIVNQSHEIRVKGAAAHLISIPFPVFGPLILSLIFGLKSLEGTESWRVFWADIRWFCVTFSITAISILLSIRGLWDVLVNGQSFDLWGAIIKSVLVWAVLALAGLWNTIGAILGAIRVMRKGIQPPKKSR